MALKNLTFEEDSKYPLSLNFSTKGRQNPSVLPEPVKSLATILLPE